MQKFPDPGQQRLPLGLVEPQLRCYGLRDAFPLRSAADGGQLFTSLYSLLPSSKKYLIKGGLSPSAASFTLIGCFLGGVIGIQLLSRLIHQYIPSHVVGCDHTHDDDDDNEGGNDTHSQRDQDSTYGSGHCHEDTPLLQRPAGCEAWEDSTETDETERTYDRTSRPSLPTRLTRQVTSLVSGRRALCDGDGPCYGYSEPCGQECFKVRSRSPSKLVARRSVSGPAPLHVEHERPAGHAKPRPAQDMQSSLEAGHARNIRSSSGGHPANGQCAELSKPPPNPLRLNGAARHSNLDVEHGHSNHKAPVSAASQGHHHHVHSNAFLSIGLQTSTAIALHKLPEGFITFATNHANPTLGFAVFLALFIHNITEGFAMALPLFLAFNSRFKAIFWSSLLGGVSQPLGAGIAALWLRTAGDHDMAPGERVYGAMFAITSGIMTSVALQLFAESLALTHQKTWCSAWAFVGMGILGLSFALTA